MLTGPNSATSHKGLALVVAIANYTTINSLPEAVLNDARDFSAVLTNPQLCCYSPNDVKLLLDGAATTGAISEGLGRLAKGCWD